MGEFYAGLATEVDTARWVAMGEFHTKLAEVQHQRALEADAAR
jgi:hypothetical protein